MVIRKDKEYRGREEVVVERKRKRGINNKRIGE
jgi:hypothetical protein